jgi:hypothetical protein
MTSPALVTIDPDEVTSGEPSVRRMMYSITSASLSSWIENQSQPCWLSRSEALPNS